MSNRIQRDLGVLNRHLQGDDALIAAFGTLSNRASGFDLDHLLGEIDASDYSATDWVEALVEFDRWLEGEGIQKRPFVDMVGYVHCCTLMNAPQVSLPSLKVIVCQSLTDFGFAAVSESQN
ncbi:MAG: hypothetical protein AAGF67_05015 [Verrucomicrobiota bacterium]